MAKQNPQRPDQDGDDGIPVVTIPGSLRKKFGNIFLITAILVGEFILAYTIVSMYYADIYQLVHGHPPDFGGYYQIEEIVVNPAETEGTRYLVVSVGLKVRNSRDLDQIESQEVVIRDAMINMLGRRTVSELADIDERNQIKQELGMMTNQILGKRAVRNLFFTQYVMQ